MARSFTVAKIIANVTAHVNATTSFHFCLQIDRIKHGK